MTSRAPWLDRARGPASRTLAPGRRPAAPLRRGALAAGLALAGLVSSCGGQAETGGRTVTKVVTARGASTAPTPVAPASTPAYSVDLPPGWRKATPAQKRAIPFKADSFFFGARTAGFTTNVNVQVLKPRRPLSAEQIARASRTELRSRLGAQVIGPIRRARLGGEPAGGNDYRLRLGSRQLRGRQLGAFHDGRFYQVTFTALASTFAQQVGRFEHIVASWRWTGAPGGSGRGSGQPS